MFESKGSIVRWRDAISIVQDLYEIEALISKPNICYAVLLRRTLLVKRGKANWRTNVICSSIYAVLYQLFDHRT